MKFFVKNMTSPRSKGEVRALINILGLNPTKVEIGEVEIEGELCFKRQGDLNELLNKKGYKLIVNKEQVLVEKIKCILIEMVHYTEELPKTKYSHFLTNKTGINYTILSKLFSKSKRITIEQFIIAQKIERVKRLLVYNELTITEIAWRLQYSSTAHLSAQFKKVTGITPSVFKKKEYKNLMLPDDLNEIHYDY